MHAWCAAPSPAIFASYVCGPLTAASGLAMCACLAVSVFPGLSILVPRLSSRVALAVRADAREREREREKYYTYPATRLVQVLPGHPLADPKR